jgi:putative hydrolase of the HAD superfamily
MNKTVFWDLDETLTYNNAFVDARREFAQLMNNHGFDYDHADAMMETIDSTAVATHGFGDKFRFSNSMVEAYTALCFDVGSTPDFKVKEQAKQIGLAAMTKPVQLITSATRTIKAVTKLGYKQYIVTKGNVEFQEKKIFDTKLDKLVDGWFVFDHKTTLEMYDVLKTTKSSARDSFFIGNSPKSDVNPAYRAGMSAIYIPHKTTWSAEIEPLLAGVIVVSKIHDVLEHLPSV